jgi:hypothetical protein
VSLRLNLVGLEIYGLMTEPFPTAIRLTYLVREGDEETEQIFVVVPRKEGEKLLYKCPMSGCPKSLARSQAYDHPRSCKFRQPRCVSVCNVKGIWRSAGPSCVNNLVTTEPES